MVGIESIEMKKYSTRFSFMTAILGLTSLILSSCLPEPLEVHSLPKAKPQIVVSSQIIPDESFVVLLTKTFGALDASDDSDPEELLSLIAINDAIVTIKGPAGVDTLEFVGNGIYGSNSINFEIAERYELYVTSASMGSVYAATEVKPTVRFESIDADLYYNNFNDTLAQINYTLIDPPEQNFYMINVQEIEREDVVENLLNPRAFTVLLDDAAFNAQSYSDQFRVFPRDYQPGDSIAVTLSNISEEYYRFMQLRIDNRANFVEFISEPVNYPSNVVGGKGFFNLYVPDVRFFVFD
jgi:hypothetical protein